MTHRTRETVETPQVATVYKMTPTDLANARKELALRQGYRRWVIEYVMPVLRECGGIMQAHDLAERLGVELRDITRAAGHARKYLVPCVDLEDNVCWRDWSIKAPTHRDISLSHATGRKVLS